MGLIHETRHMPGTFMKECICIYVTGPEKTGLIYAKYTHSYYGECHFLCSCYLISASFIEFLRILCIPDKVCVMILRMLPS